MTIIAWGSGRDFAIGALASGKNPCASCGIGVDAFDLLGSD